MRRLHEALVLASCLLLAVAVAQGQPTESYGDMIARIMDEHRERAIARWKEERAQWEAMLAQAESEAIKGRALKSWVAPPVNNTGPVKYVDLSQWPSELKSSVGLKAAFNWNARGARYPRFPKLNIPVPNMLVACPDGNSVKSFGAVGDGSTDDSGAIMRAAAQKDFLYFPPGNYRIASSITVDKPMVFAQRSYISTESGVVMTITKRIRWWNVERPLPFPLFLGTGEVKFSGDCDIVTPTWFKRWGESDSDAFQKAVDGCQGSCTMILNRELQLDKAIFLKPNVGIFSGVAGQLISPQGKNPNGLVLTPGKYDKPIYITTIWNFTGFAVKIQGGVVGAEIQLGSLDKNGDGIVFAPDEGRPPLISNVRFTELNSLNELQNQVVIVSNSPRNVLRNCLVSGSFVNGPGKRNINAPSSGLVFRGRVPPVLQRTSVIFQSFETQMASDQPSTWSRVVWVRNLTPKPANNVVFQVRAWSGGTTERAVNSMLAQGKFNGLKFLVANGGGWAPSARNTWRVSGKKNYISNGEVSNAGLTWSAPSTPDISQWKPSNPSVPGAGMPVVDGVFFVKIEVVGTWRAGETRSFYAWTAYARISNEMTRFRRDWVVFRAYNPGLVVSSIENQSRQQDGRIKINVKNIGGDFAMSDWRFGVQMI